MSPRDPHTVSRTHERAVLRQDNGELAEDVLETEAIDTAPERDGELDEQLEGSFPASDPPSTWGGEATEGDDGTQRRLVDRNEVVHPPERVEPDDPVPKTLPRDVD